MIVSFDENDGSKRMSKPVNAAAARLNVLIYMSDIAAHFSKYYIPMHFPDGHYLMTPVFFNNVYKGAIGEFVGEYIFSEIYHLRITDIADARFFEKFDWQLEDRPDVFIDFKYWKNFNSQDEKDALNKNIEKAREVGASLVIVANILQNSNARIKDTIHNGIRILQIPNLIDINNGGMAMNQNSDSRINKAIDETRKS